MLSFAIQKLRFFDSRYACVDEKATVLVALLVPLAVHCPARTLLPQSWLFRSAESWTLPDSSVLSQGSSRRSGSLLHVHLKQAIFTRWNRGRSARPQARVRAQRNREPALANSPLFPSRSQRMYWMPSSTGRFSEALASRLALSRSSRARAPTAQRRLPCCMLEPDVRTRQHFCGVARLAVSLLTKSQQSLARSVNNSNAWLGI